MDANDLKKILAGLCIAGLISGSALTLSGCAGQKAAGGEKPSAGSSQSGSGTAEQEKKPAKSG